jgi:hypothetical protein
MGHPKLDNPTPLAFEPAFLADEEGRPLFVPVVKGTWRIVDGARLELAEKQVPVNLAGEYWGNPDTTSYKYEPECVFFKPTTDVVLIGHACPAEPGAREVTVGLRVGPVQKVVRVVGDRFWVKGASGRPTMTAPRPFERIPLLYERAFGGWDRNDPDPNPHSFEPRNPLGTGFRLRWSDAEKAVRLPNLEDPRKPIKSLSDRPPPAGFGFTSPNWQPRAALAGTYDQAWMKTRMPLLPKDFDRHFFNAASPGLIAPGHLKGDEPVVVVNAAPAHRLPSSERGGAADRCRAPRPPSGNPGDASRYGHRQHRRRSGDPHLAGASRGAQCSPGCRGHYRQRRRPATGRRFALRISSTDGSHLPRVPHRALPGAPGGSVVSLRAAAGSVP